MATQSTGLTDEIHAKIKRIRDANNITIGGFANIALMFALTSNTQTEKVLNYIEEHNFQKKGAGRLNEYDLLA